MRRLIRRISPRLFVRLPLFLARLRRALFGLREMPDGPPSFLIVRLDAMGDLILTTPLFRDLKRSFPGSTITVVTHHAFRSLIEDNPFVDELFTLPPVNRRALMADARFVWLTLKFVLLKLSRHRYSHAISPRWDIDIPPANLLCLLAPASRTVGFPDRSKVRFDWPFSLLGNLFDITVSAIGVEHEVFRGRSVVNALGGTCSHHRPEIFPRPQDRQNAAGLLYSAPHCATKIAIGIGAQDAYRRWPIENYAQVIRELGSQCCIFSVIVCAPSEKRTAERLAALVDVPSCVIAEADLRVAVSVMELCDVFIGNDSGPAHMAAAAGCAVVVISPHPRGGDRNHANSPVRFAPLCERCIVLQPSESQPPCLTFCGGGAPHCILAVTPEQVVQAVQTVIPQRSNTTQDSFTV